MPINLLQQYLPFTVLKRITTTSDIIFNICFVATVLTVYGIETVIIHLHQMGLHDIVATVLTVYGIETRMVGQSEQKIARALQQYLPFTVLKLYN